MNHRQRLLTALDHQEPDRVPFDLGSTQVTGIHTLALQALRQELGLPAIELQVCDAIQGLALPGEDLIQRLGVDVRGLYPRNSHNWNVVEQDDGEYWRYHDEWGIIHRKPKDGGLYYSLFQTPLACSDLTAKDVESRPWPDFSDPERIAGLRQQAEAYHAAGYAVVLKDPFAGIFEMSQRIVGMENLLIMMASDPALAGVLFEKLAELKLAFWEMALPQLADVIDVISQADDYGTQASQIISPRMFRQQIKPHWKTVLQRIQELAPKAKRFFHSCGSVRPLIPDFIEIGVEILNPVHIRATGMQPAALKHDFGEALSFWGGGVDTQDTLPHGTPEQIKDEVRRNIEALAPGGGFVFNTVHNIQADVPPGNITAMWEALQEYGVYA
ncbi:MAG: uroporphyrinogen decarboxylase family protein [Chloroflexota bacterium]